MSEICQIVYNEEALSWWQQVLAFLRGFNYRNYWFEAKVNESVIAKSDRFKARETDIDALGSPEWQGVFASHKQRLIYELMAEGWEPIKDPDTGEIDSMRKATA